MELHMANNTLKFHKATYLIQRFIRSGYFRECKLKAHEVSTLFVIASYLDMKDNKCYPQQTTLAIECGMSIRQLRMSIEKLRKLKLIIVYTSWRNNGYELGDYFDEKLSPAYCADDNIFVK